MTLINKVKNLIFEKEWTFDCFSDYIEYIIYFDYFCNIKHVIRSHNTKKYFKKYYRKVVLTPAGVVPYK